MPHLRIIASGGAAARRLVAEELEALSKKGRAFAGTREGGEWPALIAAGRSAGLFDEKRVSVVESAELLGPFPEELVPYLEGEDASEVILLLFEKDPGKVFSPAAKKKIAQIKGESVPFWSAQRKRWLLDLARKEGVAVSDDAAALLVELLEDPEEVRAELLKLGAYAHGGSVDAGMVKELSFDEGRNTMLKFLDAFCQARAPEVFAALERFKQEPSMLPLLTGLYNRIRPALYLGIFPSAGGERVRSALEIKDYALKMGREALRHYSPKALGDLSFGLLALSWKEKTSFAEGWPGFESLLIDCMASAGRKQ